MIYSSFTDIQSQLNTAKDHAQNNHNKLRVYKSVGSIIFKCCRSRGCEFDPARSHTFVEIDHDIIHTVILLPSAESFKKGSCQLQAKVCARSTG